MMGGGVKSGVAGKSTFNTNLYIAGGAPIPYPDIPAQILADCYCPSGQIP